MDSAKVHQQIPYLLNIVVAFVQDLRISRGDNGAIFVLAKDAYSY